MSPANSDAVPADPNDGNDNLSEDAIREFIAAQREETQVRKDELEVRKKELEQNKEISEVSIQANLQDRENQRDFYRDRERIRQRYGTFFFVLILLFIFGLVYLGEREIALELVKLALYAGGGYYAGKKVGESGSSQEAQ